MGHKVFVLINCTRRHASSQRATHSYPSISVAVFTVKRECIEYSRALLSYQLGVLEDDSHSTHNVMIAQHQNRSLWASLAVASIGLTTLWYVRRRRRQCDDNNREQHQKDEAVSRDENGRPPVSEIQTSNNNGDESNNNKRRILTRGSITIAHGSMTGTCAKFAQRLLDTLQQEFPSGSLLQMGTTEDWDWWDEFINDEEENEQTGAGTDNFPALLILLLPTYTEGTWPPCATLLESALQELQNDWRIQQFPLKHKLHVALFGMGSSEYTNDEGNNRSSNMGRPIRQAVRLFQKLGAKSVVKLQVGDDAVGNHAETTFEAWRQALWTRLRPRLLASGAAPQDGCACTNNEATTDCCQRTTGSDTSCASAKDNTDYDDDYPSDDDDGDGEPEVADLEDMGDAVLASQSSNNSKEPREMVTPSQAQALRKEGYKLIGTHSAVKLCRWTKHQLRGRGGCYKHTFYGITSYQCMEATPSLACANKCVFCWRHHKNPVGKEWRWKTDDPHFVVDQAVKAHIQMIKEAKGIPGVRMDRWREAHTVRHCALSLVGEPIMYPRIDEFLGDLHQRKISTFLVTNGQHPHAIQGLRPITQLYVSVDAPTRDSLIAIDRPLFRDAWDRLKQSLASLKAKGQRTVARLTVVKGWNSDEVAGYAKLIALGHVSLVELKGVTFCGKSDASNLNMSNSPWHHEVVELTKTLKLELDKIRAAAGGDALPEYDLACEHKHSCSVLLARVDQFAVDDPVTRRRKWRTWIDYDKFHELAARHRENASFSFGVTDYTADTPSWALFGADEEGFDPTDTRHRKPKKQPKYTEFDDRGIPTHDHNNQALSDQERERLLHLMEQRRREIGGDGSTVTELRGGEKEIQDASLMFRGLVVAK